MARYDTCPVDSSLSCPHADQQECKPNCVFLEPIKGTVEIRKTYAELSERLALLEQKAAIEPKRPGPLTGPR